MKQTNTLHYGFAACLGAFVSGAFALQFSHSWLWGTVGAIFGILVGWVVAMFANDPKGFWTAIKHARIKAWEEITVTDHSKTIFRLRNTFWLTMFGIGLAEIVFFVLYLLFPPTIPVSYFALGLVLMVPTTVIFAYIVTGLIPGTEASIAFEKKALLYLNPVCAPFSLAFGLWKILAWLWGHRAAILRGAKVFGVRMYLYVHANDGLAFLLHISAATCVGLFFGSIMICAFAGFVLGCADRFVHKKSHDHLLAIVGREE